MKWGLKTDRSSVQGGRLKWWLEMGRSMGGGRQAEVVAGNGQVNGGREAG
ncbi:hypothetical protein ACQCVE_18000 [Metabacillus sp. 113a]